MNTYPKKCLCAATVQPRVGCTLLDHIDDVITVLIGFTCFSIAVCMSKMSAPFTCKFLTFVPNSTFCIANDSMAVESMSKFAFHEHKSVPREEVC